MRQGRTSARFARNQSGNSVGEFGGESLPLGPTACGPTPSSGGVPPQRPPVAPRHACRGNRFALQRMPGPPASRRSLPAKPLPPSTRQKCGLYSVCSRRPEAGELKCCQGFVDCEIDPRFAAGDLGRLTALSPSRASNRFQTLSSSLRLLRKTSEPRSEPPVDCAHCLRLGSLSL